MIFFENERSKVWTLRASFQGIARFFATLGGFDLGWYWLKIPKKGFLTVLSFDIKLKKGKNIN